MRHSVVCMELRPHLKWKRLAVGPKTNSNVMTHGLEDVENINLQRKDLAQKLVEARFRLVSGARLVELWRQIVNIATTVSMRMDTLSINSPYQSYGA